MPVEINKEHFTYCGLECQIMGLETYFEANIVDSKLEIGILFRISDNLAHSRVQMNLKGVHSELETNS